MICVAVALQLAADQAEMARDFSNFRTRTLAIWGLTNLFLISLTLHVGVLNEFGEGLAIIMFWNLGTRFIGASLCCDCTHSLAARARGAASLISCASDTIAGSLFYQCGRYGRSRMRKMYKTHFNLDIDEAIRNQQNMKFAGPAGMSNSASISNLNALLDGGSVSPSRGSPSRVDRQLSVQPVEDPPVLTNAVPLPEGAGQEQSWSAHVPAATPMSVPPPPHGRSHLESVFDFDNESTPMMSPRRTISRSDPLLYPDDWRRTSEPPTYYDRTPYLLSREADLAEDRSRHVPPRSFSSERGSTGYIPVAAPRATKPVRKVRRIIRKVPPSKQRSVSEAPSPRRPASLDGDDAKSFASVTKADANIGQNVRNLARTISSAVKAELSMALASPSGKK